MQDHLPSTTSWRVALRRATHQLLDRPLILDDPLAIPIVGTAATDAALAQFHAASPRRQHFSTALRALVVARSRFAEDHLAAAVVAGVQQYVLLGAGLDTFPYRNPHPNLHTFEVDHPATQSWKRHLLATAQIPIPPTHTFVPINFETQTLVDALPAAGFHPAAPAFFSWLGVVPYLTLPAFRQTLAFLGTLPKSTQLALDYAADPASHPHTLPLPERLALEALSTRVAAAGEPFQLFLSTPQIHAELTTAGFTHIEDLSADPINARYFQNRTDHFQISGTLGHLLHATI